MTTAPAPSKILSLTSARFFAAVYVMLYHTLRQALPPGWEQGMLARIVSLGYVSVGFFFMLSGFILAVVYLKDDKPVKVRGFLVARFARIYPLYLAALLLDLPHFLHTQMKLADAGTDTLATVAATVGLIQAWFEHRVGLNLPGWSLSAEAFFYVLFPFLGVALWRMRGWFVAALSIAVYTGGVWLVWTIEKMRAVPAQQSYNPFPFLFVFVLGICLAKLFVWIGRRPERMVRLESYAPWLLLGGVAAFLAIPVLGLPRWDVLLQHGFLAPLFGLIILAFASGNGMISAVFSARWLVVLGEASFALYLLHFPIHTLMRRAIERYGLPMLLVYFVVTIGLSVASLYWLEIPSRRWILEKERVRSLETDMTSSLAQ